MVIQEEQDAIYGYTVSYHNINEPLRGLTYYGSQTSVQLGLQRIPLIEGIINKSSYDFDMWLQRGDKLVALKKFGLANFSTATDTEIKAFNQEELDYKDLEVECVVTATPGEERITLRNIAEIAEDNNALEIDDRDSTPANVDARIFKEDDHEDDEDFEKLVIEPAIKTEFDAFCQDKGYNPNAFENRI